MNTSTTCNCPVRWHNTHTECFGPWLKEQQRLLASRKETRSMSKLPRLTAIADRCARVNNVYILDHEYYRDLARVDPFQNASPCWVSSGFKYQQYE